MAEVLAPLRPELNIMPSPVPEQPGLLMRDPYRYSDAVIIVPLGLAQTLVLFDGEHTDADLKVLLTRATGDIIRAADIARDLIKVLEESGFLQSHRFFDLCDRKRREFAEAEIRDPAHAGSGYPDDAEELSAKLSDYGANPETSEADSLVAIAAPHVSPEGGFKSYAAAYRRLNPSYADKTFVILGTSHYGEPEKFGLTLKPYQTPFGAIETDRALVDRLERQAASAIEMEDYCHSSEHSIEFQCVFLAHVLGTTDFKILPILCGPLVESLYTGKAPESNDSVRGFFDALGELADTRRKDFIWVLGIDMAHIGRRYGDPTAALADQGHMMEVRERDVDRLARVCAGDAEGFFDLVHPNRDDLRWCGYSPVYTFLSAVKGVEGKVLNYEQWNIGEESVVSFAGVEFRETGSSES